VIRAGAVVVSNGGQLGGGSAPVQVVGFGATAARVTPVAAWWSTGLPLSALGGIEHHP
jgi:hypothetical protein